MTLQISLTPSEIEAIAWVLNRWDGDMRITSPCGSLVSDVLHRLVAQAAINGLDAEPIRQCVERVYARLVRAAQHGRLATRRRLAPQ
mgnify:FL=1